MSTELSIAKECKKQLAIHDKKITSLNRATYALFAKNKELTERIESDDITTNIYTSVYTLIRTIVYVITSMIKVCLLVLLSIGYLYSIRETITYGYFSYLTARSVSISGMICESANIYIPSVETTNCRFNVLKCTNHTHELFMNPYTNIPFSNYTEMINYGRPYLKPYECDLSHSLYRVDTNVMHINTQTIFDGSHFFYNVTFVCLETDSILFKNVYHFQIQPDYYIEIFSAVKDRMIAKC